MVNSVTFQIEFIYKSKRVEYVVDKMTVDCLPVPEFYRVTAKTGNRDLIKSKGVWTVLYGYPIEDDVLQIVGEAIELAEQQGFPNKTQKRCAR